MASIYELNTSLQALRKECEDALQLIRAQRQLLETARETIANLGEHNALLTRRIAELEGTQKEGPLDAKPDA